MKQSSPNRQEFKNQIFHVYAAGHRLRVKTIEPQKSAAAENQATLVFLHEGLGCIELWRDFPEVLCASTGCRGLVYERKGYGGSDMLPGPWKEDYLIEESSVDLPGLLKKCNVDDVILIGHSDGGTIALIMSALNGDVVRGVITEAAHIFVEDVTIAGIHKAVEAYAKDNLKDKLARYHKENTEMIFRRWADRWLSPEYRNWNVEEYLSEITCPLLAIQGENDEYGTPAQVESIGRLVSGPVETILIPDCGHIPHFQARDTVLAEMTRFIKLLMA
jgi:pimeloyl-ACP methyl ester carboxylesterase